MYQYEMGKIYKILFLMFIITLFLNLKFALISLILWGVYEILDFSYQIKCEQPDTKLFTHWIYELRQHHKKKI